MNIMYSMKPMMAQWIDDFGRLQYMDTIFKGINWLVLSQYSTFIATCQEKKMGVQYMYIVREFYNLISAMKAFSSF